MGHFRNKRVCRDFPRSSFRLFRVYQKWNMTRINSSRAFSSSNGAPLEKETQKVCLEWLKMKRYMCWRSGNVGVFDKERNVYRTGTVRGIPDITCIINGK